MVACLTARPTYIDEDVYLPRLALQDEPAAEVTVVAEESEEEASEEEQEEETEREDEEPAVC